MKGYSMVRIDGLDVGNIIKLNSIAEEKKWKVTLFRRDGKHYCEFPSCLRDKIFEILGVKVF